MQARIIIIGSAILLFLLLVIASHRNADILKFGGGPQGGIFIEIATGIVDLVNNSTPDFKLEAVSSGGSVDNLKAVDSGEIPLALAYSGDSYLGHLGKLENEKGRFENVRALGRVYGSTAQLVVRKESIIQSPYDLESRRVAIGSSGSGAAHSAERYFRALGIWDKITPLYIGYALGMDELSANHAEAVWQLVGMPSPSIVELNRKQPLRLIDLSRAARATDFYAKYPFYSETEIPAGTYLGQETAVETFQDNCLLITHVEADKKLLQTTLNLVYSRVGINSLRKVHPAANDLEIHKGLQSIEIPLHPVAESFWEGMGQL
jgi:TRAP transporter TAXI family solute receptor